MFSCCCPTVRCPCGTCCLSDTERDIRATADMLFDVVNTETNCCGCKDESLSQTETMLLLQVLSDESRHSLRMHGGRRGRLRWRRGHRRLRRGTDVHSQFGLGDGFDIHADCGSDVSRGEALEPVKCGARRRKIGALDGGDVLATQAQATTPREANRRG